MYEGWGEAGAFRSLHSCTTASTRRPQYQSRQPPEVVPNIPVGSEMELSVDFGKTESTPGCELCAKALAFEVVI